MNIDQANIANLTGLWKKYGAENLTLPRKSKVTEVTANSQWPHRLWQAASIEDSRLNSVDELTRWLELTPSSYLSNATVPVWPFALEDKPDVNALETSMFEQQLNQLGWQCAFEQTAMYLPLREIDTKRFAQKEDFSVQQVQSSQQLAAWVSIASEAFGYSIDQQVFEKLIDDPSIQILLGMSADEPVATALLYQDDVVIGLHQMGVGKAFQGKGFAKSMMHELILFCVDREVESLVLQASQAGKPLYDSLGFLGQFGIKNYRKC